MAADMIAAAARKHRAPERSPLERRELFELFETGINLLPSQRAEPIHTEALATEAAHHGAVDHGAAQFARVDIFALEVHSRAGERAHEAARKTVAGAGGIEDVFEQISRHHEVL